MKKMLVAVTIMLNNLSPMAKNVEGYDFSIQFDYSKYNGYDYLDYLDYRESMIDEYGIEEYVEINQECGIYSETESFIDYHNIKINNRLQEKLKEL